MLVVYLPLWNSVQKPIKRGGLIFFLFFLLFSCKKEELPVEQTIVPDYQLNIPKGFDQPVIPSDNKLTEARIHLGEKLFFDPILSRDSTVSCGTCHKKELAFTDGLPVSIGIAGRQTFRNSPTLLNVAYQQVLFMDGGSKDLETQVFGPIESFEEMDFTILDASNRLKNISEYVELSQYAYAQDPSPYVITRALAAFERSLISGNSRFDDYYYKDQKNALTDEEKKGLDLFFSEKTNCTQCHSGFYFTNLSYENIGLYTNYIDQGRGSVTADSVDIGKFKVPTLRNIAITAPYMHDGSMQNLEEVINHFDLGGREHKNKSTWIKPLLLNELEKQQLISFLKTLTNKDFE